MSTPIAAANISDGESEDSKIGQFVAILTPIFAAGAGLIVGWVAKQLPGVQLDQTQITAFMVTIATSALACDLTLRACRAGVDRGRRSLGAAGGRSGGFRSLARLLPGLGRWLLDRWVTHGRSRAAAFGPAWGAPGGFRRSSRRAERAQQARKPAAHPVG
jgi:hypothetical protein